MISETHATDGKADAMTTILKNKGIHSFWSNGGSRRAGVCILINQKFLRKFNFQEPVWGEDPWPFWLKVDLDCVLAHLVFVLDLLES